MSTLTEKLRLNFLWSIKNELLVTLLLGALFGWAVPLIRQVDPTAAPLDLGILHFVVLAPLVVSSGILFFWFVVNLVLTFVDRWFDGKHEMQVSIASDFHKASPAARLFFFLGVFAVVVLSYTLALLAFAG